MRAATKTPRSRRVRRRPPANGVVVEAEAGAAHRVAVHGRSRGTPHRIAMRRRVDGSEADDVKSRSGRAGRRIAESILHPNGSDDTPATRRAGKGEPIGYASEFSYTYPRDSSLVRPARAMHARRAAVGAQQVARPHRRRIGENTMSASTGRVAGFVWLLVLGIVAWQAYLGITIQEIGIP